MLSPSKVLKALWLQRSVLVAVGICVGVLSCWIFRETADDEAGHYEIPRHPDLLWLETADPLSDFRRDFATGERRFWGVYGSLCEETVPGIDRYWDFERIKAQGVRFIPHTSLCTANREDTERATFYACRYNTLMRLYLEN